MLKGEVPPEMTPVLYGANLFAFKKKDNGIRPIAVGQSLRRMVSRIVCSRSCHLNSELRPIQLGFATKGGVEAAVHGARYYIEDAMKWEKPQVFLKLDVKNAFNCLDRNRILESTEQLLPAYYPYVWQCYGEPSVLIHGPYRIASQAGIQQGDPLGPLLYCLATVGPHKQLKSKFVESFLDDDAIAGDPDDVYDCFCTIKDALRERALLLNISKCELVVLGGSEQDRRAVYDAFLLTFPSLQCPELNDLHYLGAPLHDSSVASTLASATEVVARMTGRLKLLPAHQALYLLRCSLGPVRMTYKLRTGRCYLQKDFLRDFDNMIRECLSAITNTAVTDTVWLQASLPVLNGGLGVRSIEKLALPAFLASAYSVLEVTSEIVDFKPDPYCATAISQWQEASARDVPPNEIRRHQKAWDLPVIEKEMETLRAAFASDISSQARMLAVCTKDSGAWLQALPAASLGNLLNGSALRIGVALRLGVPVCNPHQCVCEGWMDTLGYHGSSCKLSAGRMPTHVRVNSVVKRAIASAGVQSELEPPGISRTDGKRPDGVTLTPWERGEMLAWDVTCRCTMALSYITATSKRAGAAAAQAEQDKTVKYRNIVQDYLFCPLGFETLGPWGPEAVRLISELGKRIQMETGEKRATEYLRQRISIEIQRGNAASILGTAPPEANLDEIFSVIRPAATGGALL